MLGRSFKPKIKTQVSRKESQEKREKAEQMRRSHREKELSGSKWKPGSSDVAPDARPAKAKLLRGRKVMKMKTAKKSQSKVEKIQSQEEKCPSQEEKCPSQEEKCPSQEEKLRSEEEKSEGQEEKSEGQEEKSESQEGKSQSQEEPKYNEDEHSTIQTEDEEELQEEMVCCETDQQDWSQPTFPDFSDLTFSSNDHQPLIQPLPPCMVFFQVHQDHLCSPVAHLGSWPAPPMNSIFVPPDFALESVPDLLKRTCDLKDSSDMEDEDDSEAEEDVEGSTKTVSSEGGQKWDQGVPNLTDSSDVEDFYKEADPDNQTTFPDISISLWSIANLSF